MAAAATEVRSGDGSTPRSGGSEGADSTAQSPSAVGTANGRDKIHWGKEIWDKIDNAVHAEMIRTRVGQKFLPLRPVLPRTTSVPSDFINIPVPGGNTYLDVDEGGTTRLNEYWVEFSLTPQQVDHESRDERELGHSTAVTLATRAANVLAQAEDLVIFQGASAPIFPPAGGVALPAGVTNRGTPLDFGLLDLAAGIARIPGAPPPVNVVQVPQAPPPVAGAPPLIYGANTFQQVAVAYAQLQQSGHFGPYALVLPTIPHADTYAPMAGFVITADRIKPLMTAGFYGSGSLPAIPPPPAARPAVVPANLPAGVSSCGFLLSLGGNSVDLVVGMDATTGFMQQDPNGNYRFRVVQRFALRLKDSTGVIRLEFL